MEFHDIREEIRIRDVDTTRAQRLSWNLGIPLPAAHICVNRHLYTPEDCHRFFSPELSHLHDPFLFTDMEKAVTRIRTAVLCGEHIAIYGDYDVDGITATALLHHTLRNLGVECSCYLPNRLTEGYGVSRDGIDAAAKSGARLVITVDCGIGSIDAVHYALEKGIDVIVTDHHEPGHAVPHCCAVLDPKLPDAGYPDNHLAGVGVACTLCRALTDAFGRDRQLWESMLDVVALGTAADIVPLVGENRVYASRGFEKLSTNPHLGLAALKKARGLEGQTVTTGQVVFQLAPCINAVGRLGDPRKGLDLLLTDDQTKAAQYAKELVSANDERRAIHKQVEAEASEWVQNHCRPDNDFGIVAAREDWHYGVIGIVASKIVEQFHRPAILFSLQDGVARGSGRSIPALHLLDTLHDCRDLLSSYGGHAAAAGVSMPASALPSFSRRFNEAVKQRLDLNDMVPVITADTTIALNDITADLVSFVKKLEPFGPANMRPVFYTRSLRHYRPPRIVGTNHVKMLVHGTGATLDAIAFQFATQFETIAGAESFSLAFTVDENTWNNKTTLQMKVKGFFQ